MSSLDAPADRYFFEHRDMDVPQSSQLVDSHLSNKTFVHTPAAPDIDRYTEEPLTPSTSATDAPTGHQQHFVEGRDIPNDWWTLFKSSSLDALVTQSLENNPSLQSALATLRANKEAVHAQEGKFLPLVLYDFNPTRQLSAPTVSPVLASSENQECLAGNGRRDTISTSRDAANTDKPERLHSAVVTISRPG